MNLFIFFRAVITVLFFATSSSLLAEPMQADRPGFSTGTYTVAQGVSHLEFGFQSENGSNTGGPDTLTAPLLNFRMGLNATTELNILVDGWSQERSQTGSVTFSSDMLIGAKHRLIEKEQYNISLLGFVSLPTGNTPDSDYFNPFFGLLWDYDINSNISAFGTFQFISFVEGGQRSNNFQPAIGLAFSHTDKLSTFVEYYRDSSLNLDTKDIEMFDAGIAYLLSDNRQIDLNFGVSINRDANDFVGAGFALRF